MADFFSNLILRSSPASKGAGSILQPRLPSLFESTLGGTDELPTPQTDLALNLPPSVPDAFSAQPEARQPAEAARPAAATVTGASPAPKANPAAQVPSQPQAEPVRTIRAPLAAAGNVFSPTPAFETEVAPVRSTPQPEPGPINAPQAQGQRLSPLQAQPKSTDGLRPSLEQVPSKAILQPMPLAKPAPSAAQPQSAPQEHGETVVQVHIGRIEVRAVMPPTLPIQPAQTSRSQPKMSLDEYLRQREEKR